MANWIVRALAFAVVTCSPSMAWSCSDFRALDYDKLSASDAVVVGRISGYNDDPEPDGFLREPIYTVWPEEISWVTFNTYHVRGAPEFKVSNAVALKGVIPVNFTVRWNYDAVAHPHKLEDGYYVLALGSDNRSFFYPLMEYASWPMPNDTFFELLQDPCAGSFIFKVGSKEEKLVREKLKALEMP